MSENAARGKLILSAIMDALIGKRIAAKELATRALALGIAGGHWRLDGIPRRQLARRIGVTHAALCRRVSEIRAHFKGKPPTAKSGNAPTRQR